MENSRSFDVHEKYDVVLPAVTLAPCCKVNSLLCSLQALSRRTHANQTYISSHFFLHHGFFWFMDVPLTVLMHRTSLCAGDTCATAWNVISPQQRMTHVRSSVPAGLVTSCMLRCVAQPSQLATSPQRVSTVRTTVTGSEQQSYTIHVFCKHLFEHPCITNARPGHEGMSDAYLCQRCRFPFLFVNLHRSCLLWCEQ